MSSPVPPNSENMGSKPPTRPSSGEGGVSEMETLQQQLGGGGGLAPGAATTAGGSGSPLSAAPVAAGGGSNAVLINTSSGSSRRDRGGRSQDAASKQQAQQQQDAAQQLEASRREGFTRKSNTWYHFPSAGSKPKGRIGHTLISNDNKAYVYGGTNDSVNSSSAVYFGDLHCYDIVTKEWTEIDLTGATQKARAFHTAVFYNNSMWVFGGCNGRGRFNKLFSIDRHGQTVLINPRNQPPSSRYCHSAVTFEDRMYVFAGKSGGRNSNCRLSDLTYYDFARNEWQTCMQHGTIPQSRSAHACFVYGTSMLVFGGRNSEGECCEDLHEYNFHGSCWRSIDLDCAAFGRARHSITLHNGRIIVFGGWNGKKKLNDLFFFSLDTFHFENPDGAEEPPSRRECHTATVIGNTMIVFGGRFHGEFMTDISELDLNPKSLKDSCRDWLLSASPTMHRDAEQEMPQLLTKYFMDTEQHRARLFSTSAEIVGPMAMGPRPPAPPPPFSGLNMPPQLQHQQQAVGGPAPQVLVAPGVGGQWAGPVPPQLPQAILQQQQQQQQMGGGSPLQVIGSSSSGVGGGVSPLFPAGVLVTGGGGSGTFGGGGTFPASPDTPTSILAAPNSGGYLGAGGQPGFPPQAYNLGQAQHIGPQAGGQVASPGVLLPPTTTYTQPPGVLPPHMSPYQAHQLQAYQQQQQQQQPSRNASGSGGPNSSRNGRPPGPPPAQH